MFIVKLVYGENRVGGNVRVESDKQEVGITKPNYGKKKRSHEDRLGPWLISYIFIRQGKLFLVIDGGGLVYVNNGNNGREGPKDPGY